MTSETGPKLLATAAIKRQNTKPIVTQNGSNMLYFNPVSMADFDSTVVTPTLYVGFEKLSETEIIIHHIERLIPGAVRLRRSKTKRTGVCAFGPVLADSPVLRVSKGRQNHFQYRIDDLADGSQRFVLLLAKPKVVAVAPRTQTAATSRKKRAGKGSHGVASVTKGAGETT